MANFREFLQRIVDVRRFTIRRRSINGISEWINKADKELAIKTIVGGPGAGKSSFAKVIAAILAEEGRRVLFVPLHQIDFELGIAQALAEYFKQAGLLKDDPFEVQGDQPLVLILDGLDEIQMQGRAAQDSAQSFIDDLIRFTDRKNTLACKIICLITGRDLAVQSAEGSLKADGQVIHLIPYFMPDDRSVGYLDPKDIRHLDQRDEWWFKYGKAVGARLFIDAGVTSCR